LLVFTDPCLGSSEKAVQDIKHLKKGLAGFVKPRPNLQFTSPRQQEHSSHHLARIPHELDQVLSSRTVGACEPVLGDCIFDKPKARTG
ncbi:hypothetical protein N9W17_06505, partial [Jannaschia sp.]|nr:hypothetical protein [Jannaschia sp.]